MIEVVRRARSSRQRRRCIRRPSAPSSPSPRAVATLALRRAARSDRRRLARATSRRRRRRSSLRDRHGGFLGEVAAPGGRRARLLAGRRRCRRASSPRPWRSRTGASRRIRASIRVAVARAVRQNLRQPASASRAPRPSRCRSRACRIPGARGYLRKAAEALTAVLLTAALRPRGGPPRTTCASSPYGNRIHGIALRRPALLRQAGGRPELGRDRLPGRHPAGARRG